MNRKKFAIYVGMVAITAGICGCGGGSTSSVPPPTGTPVAVTFAGVAPLAVAVQTGTGKWATASASGGTLSFTVPKGTTTYAIAYVCPGYPGMGATVNSEYVIEASTQDSTTYSTTCLAFPATGSATGIADASVIAGATDIRIYGQGYGGAVGSKSGLFTATLPNGMNDVAVVAVDGSPNVLGAKIVRSQTVPGAVNGGILIALSGSDATTTQAISVTNLPPSFVSPPAVAVDYYTANGTWFPVNNTPATQYAVVPSSEAQTGDFYLFETNSADTATNQAIATTQTTTSNGPMTLPLPAPWSYAGPTAAAFPSFTFNYSGYSGVAAVGNSAEIEWFPSSTVLDTATVTATAAYLNGATAVPVPDLTSLTGFFATAAHGATVYWVAEVWGGTAQWYSWYTPIPSSGSLSYVQNRGTYVEP